VEERVQKGRDSERNLEIDLGRISIKFQKTRNRNLLLTLGADVRVTFLARQGKNGWSELTIGKFHLISMISELDQFQRFKSSRLNCECIEMGLRAVFS